DNALSALVPCRIRRQSMGKRAACRSGLVTLVIALSLAVPAPSRADVAGGGPAKSDCYAVFKGVTATTTKKPTRVDCTDGDPACDSDHQCQKTCTFMVQVCENEPGIAGCTPATVTSFGKNTGNLNLPRPGGTA